MLDPQILAQVLADPGDTSAKSAAIADIATKLNLPTAAAAGRLQALEALPSAQVRLAEADGPAIASAATQLTGLSALPGAARAALLGR